MEPNNQKNGELQKVLFILGGEEANHLYRNIVYSDIGVYPVFIEDEATNYDPKDLCKYLKENKFSLIVVDYIFCSDLLPIIQRHHDGEILNLHYGSDLTLPPDTEKTKNILLYGLDVLPEVSKKIKNILSEDS